MDDFLSNWKKQQERRQEEQPRSNKRPRPNESVSTFLNETQSITHDLSSLQFTDTETPQWLQAVLSTNDPTYLTQSISHILMGPYPRINQCREHPSDERRALPDLWLTYFENKDWTKSTLSTSLWRYALSNNKNPFSALNKHRVKYPNDNNPTNTSPWTLLLERYMQNPTMPNVGGYVSCLFPLCCSCPGGKCRGFCDEHAQLITNNLMTNPTSYRSKEHWVSNNNPLPFDIWVLPLYELTLFIRNSDQNWKEGIKLLQALHEALDQLNKLWLNYVDNQKGGDPNSRSEPPK